MPMIYKAQLAQENDGEPTATVIQRTLANNVIWSRHDVGTYIGGFDPPLSATAKVFCSPPVRDNHGDVTTGTACVFTMDGNPSLVMVCGYGTPEDGSLQRRDLEGSLFVCFEVFD